MNAKILAVDDDAMFLIPLTSLLESQGYRVAKATTGDEAWEQIKSFQPDVVLLDWQIPEPDGIEIVKRMKNDVRCKNMHVIILSNRILTDDIVHAFEAGADDYMIKPYAREELLARVKVGIHLKEIKDTYVKKREDTGQAKAVKILLRQLLERIEDAKHSHELLNNDRAIVPSSTFLAEMVKLGGSLEDIHKLIYLYSQKLGEK
ncbi:MAG: response regulator transcription factor [Bacteroidota bacterium]|nr:response regulator transcription factor [Bacteroidota bacterium]